MKAKNAAAIVFIMCVVLVCGCGGTTAQGTPDPNNSSTETPVTTPESGTTAPSDETHTERPAADTTHPTITSAVPANDATSVSADAIITITFSEAMDRASVESAFRLAGDAIIDGTFSWTDDTTLAFTSSRTLDYLTEYTFTLSTTAKDKVGNALLGTFTSAFTTGDSRLSLLLDGMDDGVMLDHVLFPTGTNASFTAEAWIYPTTNMTAIAVSDNAYELGMAYNDGGPVMIVKVKSASCLGHIQITKPAITLNEWNHIAVIYDKDTSHLGAAVNGSVSFPAIFTNDFCNDSSYKFGVGNYNSPLESADKRFLGRIKEVRISNIARYTSNYTPEDVFVPDANTIALWHFDDSIGSASFSDSSGNGHTLTAVGNATTGQ